jgi:hypothetical protein
MNSGRDRRCRRGRDERGGGRHRRRSTEGSVSGRRRVKVRRSRRNGWKSRRSRRKGAASGTEVNEADSRRRRGRGSNASNKSSTRNGMRRDTAVLEIRVTGGHIHLLIDVDAGTNTIHASEKQSKKNTRTTRKILI